VIRIPLLSRPVVTEGARSVLYDALVFCAIFALFSVFLMIGRYWMGAPMPAANISRSPRMLPLYSLYSLVRIAIAYLLSLLFAVIYGYVAAYNRRLQPFMIALLDILQSIPVLSFLPGVMLAMVSLLPARQLGIELGAIVLIFTGQVWNMAFSFYSSLRSIPRELREASRIYGFSAWQRFFQLELPYGAIGLVWNSMVSVAGGWFFLMACEMFVLGKRDFRLPGLGSYLQTAASAGDTGAMMWGLAAMIGVIVLLDQAVWRPVIAWSDKFKFEQVESAHTSESPILDLLRRSRVIEIFHARVTDPLWEALGRHFARPAAAKRSEKPDGGSVIAAVAVGLLVLALVVWGGMQAFGLLRGISRGDVGLTLRAAGVTFLRVTAALVIASLWTIPAGVAIGFNPRLARIAQPLSQIAASVPATALFPVLLLAIVSAGGGLGVGSILLMLLGTQWYILFNVIAGAIAIPSDLKEAASLFRFGALDRWRTLILPGIFPYLVTGLVTASGGAWNASIVAEYFRFQERILSTFGLGAEISSATDSGRFDRLLLATMVMAALVVSVNRLVWRPLYRLAETRYKLET
jgi:NitT/TauT family transport system permease protein